MNKMTQRFALYLIDRRIKKIQKKAFKKLQKTSRVVRKATLGDYIADPQEYADLRTLRANIATINNPWQGVFATYWKYDPKDKKHIESFPEEEKVELKLKDLDIVDQAWADMSEEDFYLALAEEETHGIR